MEKVNFKLIDLKWNKKWSGYSLQRKQSKKKFYCLEMFPYPSGKIHMGHVRNYTIGDVIARYKFMTGYNVLHPMGWDAFGLPAENASRENNLHPEEWTKENIKTMKRQLQMLGLSIDWRREISTCDENYYKHQQEIFLNLYENGLVFRKENYVNWDPVEKTVLANEQVINGRGWRSNAIVERKKLHQWFFNITKFSEELLSDLENLDGWPEKVKLMQKNWIGRSTGCEINFSILNSEKKIKIFTTRPDTIFGATFIAISLDHQISKNLKINDQLKKFKEDCLKSGTTEESLANAEKIGYDTRLFAEHPFIKGKKLPIYIANFVLMDYGSGAIFGCPAHDQRDNDFAKKYKLEIIEVVKSNENKKTKSNVVSEAYTGQGTMINSDFLNGLNVEQAKEEVIKKITRNGFGKKRITYRLKDWGISRQRYWGCPIPILYLKDGTIVPVKKKDLPVKLPKDVDLNKSGNPLSNHPTWKKTTIKETGEIAIRETDTLDTFVDSSWYFLRFCSPDSNKDPFDIKDMNYWMPVDQYIGGIEHAILHLLYSRFFMKALKKSNSQINSNEPFKKLFTQGMVCHETYKDNNNKWLAPKEIEKINGKVIKKKDKSEVKVGPSQAMSKSKKNTVDPEDMINIYGSDAVRWFMLSDSPPEKDIQWSLDGINASHKFMQKLYNLNFIIKNRKEIKTFDDELSEKFEKKFNLFIHKVTTCIDTFQFNVAIANIFEIYRHLFSNINNKIKNKIFNNCQEKFLKVLIPFTPNLAFECLEILGVKKVDNWPIIDKKSLAVSDINFVVQINGKTRIVIDIKKDLAELDVKKILEDNLIVKKYTQNKKIKKIIFVKNRIINYIL